MRPNPLKQAIAEGRPVVNAWCSIGSSYVAEVIAHLGYDSVTVDLQHGAIGYECAFSMLQAISTGPAVPIVRVPWNEPGLAMKLLDAGAYGVISFLSGWRDRCSTSITSTSIRCRPSYRRYLCIWSGMKASSETRDTSGCTGCSRISATHFSCGTHSIPSPTRSTAILTAWRARLSSSSSLKRFGSTFDEGGMPCSMSMSC